MASEGYDVLIRPMTVCDVDAAERLSSAAYLEVDRSSLPRSWAEPTGRTPDRAENWRARTRHLLGTDPGGCWVADRDGDILGFATSLVREQLWVLSSYAVTPAHQGAGIGRQLLAAAAEHGRGCLRGMLNASPDPRALRLYAAAGFALHPQLLLWGRVRRADLPVVRHVRDGGADDFDLTDSLDRARRGAGHGPDHALLAGMFRLLVTDRPAASGYAYVDDHGGVVTLAASHRKAARALLWEALASSDPEVPVEIGHVSAANQWAIEVGLAARLDVYNRGFLALRHLREPAPYLPHPTLL
ncbi:MAG: GNAT family N-acetyltransferase [Nocardioides sp.]|uniref:GNAT family N-acetyltransferase n=1 Tax=Nocardioides sp. TaxID=35761 RepID=UPI0039E396DF